MIHVLATIQINTGKRADFLQELERIVETVRAEEGCIEYTPTVDLESGIPVQAAPRTDVVVIVEKWESIESLTAHLAAPHMVEYRDRVRDLVDWVDLRILHPV